MLITESEAKKLHCPKINAACLAFECMAFAPGEPLVKAPEPRHDDAIKQWMRQHPVPTEPVEGAVGQVWRDYQDNMADHRRNGERFANSLLPQAPLTSTNGVWTTGYDEEEERPYAAWTFPEMPRGYCAAFYSPPAPAAS